MNPESLQRTSHLLFWLSIILPVLGAGAGVARFYVESEEKRISAQNDDWRRSECALFGSSEMEFSGEHSESAATTG